MLDKKKRNLYIGLISASLLGTALVWFFGLGSTSSVTPALPNQTLIAGTNQLAQTGSLAQPNANVPSGAGVGSLVQPTSYKDGEFPVPGVFPATPDYDLSVLESSVYKNLKDYKVLTVDEKELGREDPFKKVE